MDSNERQRDRISDNAFGSACDYDKVGHLVIGFGVGVDVGQFEEAAFVTGVGDPHLQAA